MRHIGIQNWNRNNRSERVDSIVKALNRSGKAEATYLKGRLFLARFFLGKGHPIPVHEDDNWNHVNITYQGKNALEISDSDYGPEGQFFDENFTEGETQQIENAFADAEVVIQKIYLSRMKWIRVLQVFGALVAGLLVGEELLSGSPVLQVLPPLFITLCFLILLSRT